MVRLSMKRGFCRTLLVLIGFFVTAEALSGGSECVDLFVKEAQSPGATIIANEQADGTQDNLRKRTTPFT